MDAERSLIDSLSYYGDTLAVICYHVHGTYQNAVADTRDSFYGTSDSVTPYVWFDGLDYVWLPDPSEESQYVPYIENARSVLPSFNLYIDSATANTSIGTIYLRIVAVDTSLTGEKIAYVSILEDSLPSTVSPGVFFYHVCRDQYQFPVTLSYPDTLDTTITFVHNSIPVDKMKTVIFIQDTTTREVMQTIISPFEEE